MKLVRTALIGASALSLAACATTGQLAGADAASDQVAASATSQDAAHDALFALFEDADERSLSSPMSAASPSATDRPGVRTTGCLRTSPSLENAGPGLERFTSRRSPCQDDSVDAAF